MQRRIFRLTAVLSILVLCWFSLTGCQKNNQSSGPPRDNTPRVLVPVSDKTVVYENGKAFLDASHTADGYLMVQYRGSASRAKLQLTGPDGVVYPYDLTGEMDTLPLTAGSGSYNVKILELVTGKQYATAMTQTLDVSLTDEFTPFLYPNQYVWFAPESQTVAKGQELASGAHSDLDVVQNVYLYTIKNVTYDEDKAAAAQNGNVSDYLPVVDETLASGKGICFDYAALMTAMLRSQGIPTKLEIGYVKEVYHSWISVYITDVGWVDDIIQFDGKSWSLLDPTTGANSSNQSLKKFIGDGSGYVVKYVR